MYTGLLTTIIILVSSIAAESPNEAALALITPAPRPIDRRATATSALGSATCGYINGNVRSPLLCASGYSCSSSYTLYDYYFACCNDDGCTKDYHTCQDSQSTATESCGDSDHCLSCTGGNGFCGGYQMLAWTDLSLTTYFSAFCTTEEALHITLSATPTNTPKSTVICVPDGFNAPHTSDSCTSPIILLIPLILSNVIVFASSLLMSRLGFQNKVKFWGKGKDSHDPWKPWAGLSTASLVVVQAIATAALIRAGGYLADWTGLILLWLMRPRMQWAIMLFYASFGNAYKRAATDALFADGIINLLSLPTSAWLLEAVLKDKSCLEPFDDSNVNGFGQKDYVGLFFVGVIMYLVFSALDLFVLVFFFWPGRRKLGRWWSLGAGLYCMSVFVISWVFWTWWVFFSEDAFCVTNIGPIAAIHAVVPFLSGIARAWLT